jgi:hypothetical protein
LHLKGKEGHASSISSITTNTAPSNIKEVMALKKQYAFA